MKKFFISAALLLIFGAVTSAQTPTDSVLVMPPPYLFRDGQKVKVWKAEIKGNERTRSDADFLRSGRRDMSDTTYSIARIPISNSVSPYGGMIYSMPVATASGFNLVPSISLAYNNQGGNGVAGYGWDISGVSSIRLTNKNLYYHGYIQPAGSSKQNSAYSLDGDPLVQNDDAATSASWPLVTAHGKVLVQLNKVPITNEVKSFTALYPDGRRATFGFSSTTIGKAVYPISELQDADGNRITFTYDTPGEILIKNNYRLKEIRYGFDSNDAYHARIVFSYESRDDVVTGYFASHPLRTLTRLIQITSYDGENIIARYPLTYSDAEGVSLLKKIECLSDGRRLQPAEFDYVVDDLVPGEVDGLQLWSEAFLGEAFVGAEDSRGYVYASGRFLPNSYNDGVAIYPVRDRYRWIARKWNWKKLRYDFTYGSEYSPDQILLISPDIKEEYYVASIRAEEGFQLLQAVDTDGDGKDELVKINCGVNGTNDKTLLTLSTFHINDVTGSYSWQWSNIEVDGVVHSLDYSPIQLDYFFGDYDGDGDTDLLSISTNLDFTGENRNSHFSLIDLNTRSLVSDTTAFSYTAGNDYSRILSADIDADGKTELCHFSSDYSDIYVYTWNGQAFAVRDTLSGPGSAGRVCGGLHVTDVNADGYLDFIAPSTSDSTWTAYCYSGRGTVTSRSLHAKPLQATDTLYFRDMNQDGLSDVLIKNGPSLSYGINVNGNGFDFSPAAITIGSKSAYIGCNIMQFSGVSSFVTFQDFTVKQYWARDDRRTRRLLRYRMDGFGNYDRIIYEDLAQAASSYIPTAGRTYSLQNGFHKTVFPLMMVSEVEQRAPVAGVTENFDYTYYDAAAHNRGLGFCGFGKRETVDMRSGTVATEVYDPERFGIVTATSLALANNPSHPFKTQSNTYDNHSTSHGKLNPRLTQSAVADSLHGVVTTTTVTGYDAYDCPSTVSTSVARISGAGNTVNETVTRTWQHILTDTLYRIGLPGRELRETNADGAPGSVRKTRSDMQYDGRGHITGIQEYVADGTPGVPAASLAKGSTYQYDALGNVVREAVATMGASVSNETGYSYDSMGRYLLSSTDPLGRTTSYSGYNKFGKPATVTDHAGRSTSYTYDAWGNVTQTALPDGTVQTTSRVWSSTGEPGLYCITTTASGQPDTKVWYDALGREVRSASQRFDGSWQYVKTEYDSRGRVWRTSLPYKNAASGPSYWNTYVYDSYDRPVSYTTASGNQTTWTYSGLSTTTTKDGIASTTTTDAAGNVVQVSDAGGTISYALRDDAQPSSVTVTPPAASGLSAVTTSFQYDVYGRRTAIVDPSAGTRSDAYTDNADGSSSVAHTGPNGTVTSYYDRFGRVTSVSRPEFNTTYTYDSSANSPSYGSLLSEVSTNETLKEITYDNLGRTATVTTMVCIPDTLLLQKTFSYGTDGNVASVQYETVEGPVTTETYHYSYGHNDRITLPDGTKVFELTAENDLGLPTAVTTGTAQRSYGYTAAGLPTSRSISRPGGALVQNLGYSFDASTGNLSVRSDVLPGTDGAVSISEEFEYDHLNRLSDAVLSPDVPADSTITPPPYDYGSIAAVYNPRGNVLNHTPLTMSYNSASDPYALSSAQLDDGSGTPGQYFPGRTVTMTSFDRPASVADTIEQTSFASYDYDASGRKARAAFPVIGIERVYLGDCFEMDGRTWETPSDSEPDIHYETVQRLFLGGTAYDAPMVLVKVDDGAWALYNIGRDVQGSITHVLESDGKLLERYVYDPWGNVVQLDSLGTVIDSLAAPTPIGGAGFCSRIVGSHGYTGHEYIVGASLLNANARLYDPFLGRFLSPDPLIQDTGFTQNFNRYAYCLNNPLKYTDEDGETFIVLNISRNGILFGLNFSKFGAPVGFGYSFNWYESTYGGYIEVGTHNEVDIFGEKAMPTTELNAKIEFNHNYKKNTNSIEGKLTAKYSDDIYTYEATVSAGYKFDSNWRKTEFSSSIKASAEKNGIKLSVGYTNSFSYKARKWDHSMNAGLKIKIEDDILWNLDCGIEIGTTYSFTKREWKGSCDLFFGNDYTDTSIFSTDHFTIVEKYSSLVSDVRKDIIKKNEDYWKGKSKSKIKIKIKI